MTISTKKSVQSVTVALVNDHGLFEVTLEQNTSKPRVQLRADQLDHETQPSYKLTLRISDDSALSRDFTVVVNVTDLDEPGDVYADRRANVLVGHTITPFVIDTEGGVKDISWLWSRTNQRAKGPRPCCNRYPRWEGRSGASPGRWHAPTMS